MTSSSTAPLFNPFDPAFRADPYPFYDQLRELDPVHVSPMGFTVLTRYEDVARALRGAEFARDIEAHTPPPVDPIRLRRRDNFQRRVEEGRASKSILNLDPPDHTRIRRLVTQAFTPSAIERLRPRVQQLVDDVLDRAAERGEIELVDELAFTVPFQVISDLLDMPMDMSDQVRDWSQALTASLEPTADDATLDASEEAAEGMSEYLRGVVAHRRQHLGDDLLSALLQVEEQGDRLSTAELLSFTLLLYVAGHETTVNLIGNGTLALLRHRDELRRWANDPTMDVQAIDELLRYDGPVQQTVRVPLQPVRFGDVEVPANSMVMTVLGAANHDPAVFDDPHALRLDRPNARNHLAFAAGIHYCLGASLAKLEGSVAIGTLIRRFPDLELAGEPHWRDRLTIRGVDRLPLSLR
ncbi:MAG: cytochrome P450 [Ilumatobacteraceae bacterium]|nr:cytochrome P450 [Acidimicrobiales bacterium]MCB9395326.1 cytochrome P450 [Acidimicrobiaceae bacterium]